MNVINAEINLETAASSMTLHRLKLFADLEDSLTLLDALSSDDKTAEKVNSHYENLKVTLLSKKANLESQFVELSRSVTDLHRELDTFAEEERKLESQINIVSKGVKEREMLISAHEQRMKTSARPL